MGAGRCICHVLFTAASSKQQVAVGMTVSCDSRGWSCRSPLCAAGKECGVKFCSQLPNPSFMPCCFPSDPGQAGGRRPAAVQGAQGPLPLRARLQEGDRWASRPSWPASRLELACCGQQSSCVRLTNAAVAYVLPQLLLVPLRSVNTCAMGTVLAVYLCYCRHDSRRQRHHPHVPGADAGCARRRCC
jgi:hypothetical protein